MLIEQIDKNFLSENSIEFENMNFFDVAEKPFKVHGGFVANEENVKFRRLPADISKEISKELDWLSTCNVGERISFRTNSKKISVICELTGYGRTNRDTLLNSAGIAVHIAEKNKNYAFKCAVCPTFENVMDEINGKEAKYGATVNISDGDFVDVMLYLPTISVIKNLEIGIEKNATVEQSKNYRYVKPIVFYGSSITMGCCASRPSNIYPAMVSRQLDSEFINLGFSGNALGETSVANYIADLDMSAFVYDYDHNAPNVEHLKNTHEKFFKIIREKNPDLPIIMLTKPDHRDATDTALRADVVWQTYYNAKNNGDDKVWLINGANIFDFDYYDDCLCDGTHPNDLGYMKMAEKVSAVIKPLLVR